MAPGLCPRNPRNQRFMLLSESDVPLYSPHLVYTQVRLVGRCAVPTEGCAMMWPAMMRMH